MLQQLVSIIFGILERGAIFALPTYAMFLTFRVIRFVDLTLEGSFGLGAASVVLFSNLGLPWILVILAVVLMGACAGLVTGLLHTKLKLDNLISGIITTTALFSICLKIAGAHSVISNNPLQSLSREWQLILLLLVSFVIFFLLQWFLQTDIGFLMKATGQNPSFVENIGKTPDIYKIIALIVSNGLVALAGALFVMYTGYYSIWINVGMVIMTLAAFIIAESFTTKFSLALFFGSCTYQAIIALTYEFDIDQNLNKLITAVIVVFFIMINTLLTTQKGQL